MTRGGAYWDNARREQKTRGTYQPTAAHAIAPVVLEKLDSDEGCLNNMNNKEIVETVENANMEEINDLVSSYESLMESENESEDLSQATDRPITEQVITTRLKRNRVAKQPVKSRKKHIVARTSLNDYLSLQRKLGTTVALTILRVLRTLED